MPAVESCIRSAIDGIRVKGRPVEIAGIYVNGALEQAEIAVEFRLCSVITLIEPCGRAIRNTGIIPLAGIIINDISSAVRAAVNLKARTIPTRCNIVRAFNTILIGGSDTAVLVSIHLEAIVLVHDRAACSVEPESIAVIGCPGIIAQIQSPVLRRLRGVHFHNHGLIVVNVIKQFQRLARAPGLDGFRDIGIRSVADLRHSSRTADGALVIRVKVVSGGGKLLGRRLGFKGSVGERRRVSPYTGCGAGRGGRHRRGRADRLGIYLAAGSTSTRSRALAVVGSPSVGRFAVVVVAGGRDDPAVFFDLGLACGVAEVLVASRALPVRAVAIRGAGRFNRLLRRQGVARRDGRDALDRILALRIAEERMASLALPVRAVARRGAGRLNRLMRGQRMPERRDRDTRSTAQFRVADRAVNNRIIAARRGAGCRDYVLLHCLCRGVVLCQSHRNSDVACRHCKAIVAHLTGGRAVRNRGIAGVVRGGIGQVYLIALCSPKFTCAGSAAGS